MDEYRRIAHAHLAYAKAVLLDPPAHRCRGVLYRSAGVASLLTITLLLLTLCLALHATLPSRSPSISFLRFLAFFAILFALWPLLYDREHYTLGSDFRDIAIPSCLWLPLSEATRVCIVSLWDEEYERAPRWIVPKSEAHKWKGAYPVDGEGADATANKGDRMTNGKPNGHASANGATNDKTSSRTTTRNDDTHRMPPLIPRDWYYVPHPAPFSLLRLLWATDSMSLRRPGTSLLFPSHQRALEWSLPVLQKASEIYDRAAAVDSPREADAIRRTSPVWFGLKEWGIIASAAQLSFLVAFCRYVKSLNLSIQHGTYSPDNFYDLPLHTQYLLTFGLGSLVVFPASSGELLAHALQRVGSLPTTAVIPSFQQPLLSSGPRDFWNRRWHQFLRRDFSILAKLVPGTREFPFIRFVATFAVSAAEHSFVFSRFQRKPPTANHFIWLFLHPALQTFFLSQALCIVIEGLVFSEREGHHRSPLSSLAQRALLWVGLLTAGRSVTAHLWTLGCFDVVEFTNWSDSTRIPREAWREIT